VSLQDVLDLIAFERDRQDRKWGEQNHEDLRWFTIFMEEVGEVAKNLTERDAAEPTGTRNYWTARVREELLHSLAVGVGWMESMDRRPE